MRQIRSDPSGPGPGLDAVTKAASDRSTDEGPARSGAAVLEATASARHLLAAQLFAAHPQPMWIVDAATLRIVDANDAAVEEYGFRRQDFLRMALADLGPPEDAARLRAAMARARPGRALHEGTWRHRRRSGAFIDVELTSHALDLAGRPAQLVLARDVTERQRVEEALRLSEERYRMLLASIDQGFCVLEMLVDDAGRAYDYRFLEVNPTFEGHTGLKDAVGRTARDLVPDLEAHWVETYGRVAETGEPVAFEQGSVAMGRVFEVEAVRVGRPEERKVALLFRDVTERRRTEQALAEAQTRLRSALDAGAVGTWSWELATNTVIADERMARLFDVPVEEAAAGRSRDAFAAAVHPEDRPRIDAEVRRAVETSGRYETEYRVRSADGIHWVQARGQVHPGPDGRPARLVGATVDITPLKLAEAELREREARLQAALRVKDEFLGLVSHELRTPMTVILGMSRILAGPDVDPERLREMAADVAESAEVLNELLEGMLLLARLDQGEVVQLREPVLLHRVAEDVLARARVRDRTRRYDLEVRDRGAIVDVQRTWLERVIENLVGNAGKYAARGTTVRVVVDREGPMARLRVLDEGPGVVDDEVERLFEPFYRSERTGPDRPGVGLGLAVAKRIVELLGGRIWARPLPDPGSEFGFELPVIGGQA